MIGAAKNDTQIIVIMTQTRTLTNVGVRPGKYKVSVTKVDSVKIVVKPKSLTFKRAYEKKSFQCEVHCSRYAVEQRTICSSRVV